MNSNRSGGLSRGLQAIRAVALAAAILLSACTGATTPAPTPDVAAIQTQAAQTVVAEITENAPPPPTQAAPAAPTPTPELPGPVPDPAIPVAILPAPASGDPTATANFNTLVYSGPGDMYALYGVLLGSRQAIVVGKNDEATWWAISVPSASIGSGWVSAEWVTVSNANGMPVLPTPPVPPTTALDAPGAGDPQATSLGNTFVRTGPDVNFPAIGIAKAGDTARVLGVSQDGGWFAVRIDPSLVGAGYGWVEAGYVLTANLGDLPLLAASVAPSPAQLQTPEAGTATATALDYVNVRSGPGASYNVIAVAAPGTTGAITGKSVDSQWWQVAVTTTLSSAGFGWISAAWVHAQNTDAVTAVEAPAPALPIDPEKPINVGSCALLAQTPEDRTVTAANSAFETTWMLQNTGEDAWDEGENDILFLGAYNNVFLHIGSEVYDLPASVQPGWSVPVSIPMVAPKEPGIYAEAWSVASGNQVVCPFYVVIEVK